MPRSLRYLGSAFALFAGVLPAAAQRTVPTPESVLGFVPGADFKLATYEESIRYFEALAQAAPDRIRLAEVGRTSENRAWRVAFISSPANLANLERHRAIANRLAHPDGLSASEAEGLAREGRALVDISGGLHASEVAGAQHTIQLAYDLVRGGPRVDPLLDEVIVVLWPSLNPDGQDIVVNWYRETVGTPYEAAPMHELYQKYIGHDNNRDAYMLNVPESRVITRTWRHWEPQLIYVHHQSSPFPTRIWLPPFAEPIAPETPPIMARQANAVGTLIAQALESNGQPGATHMGDGFDAWYPGYIDYLPMLQHIVAYWTETALYRYATPYFYTLQDFPPDTRDFRARSLYSSPWKGGWWRLRDAVEYMETASIATIDYAAKYRETLLLNRYRSGRDAIERYRAEPPYAYVVPVRQRDPMAPVELLRRLAFNGVRISRLTAAARLGGAEYPAGTWVIPMDQEFAPLVRQLLDPQRYPDLREYPGGPPEQPYDAAGWTLPYLMDVHAVEIRDPIGDDVRSRLEAVRADPLDPASSPDTDLRTNTVAAGIVPPAGVLRGAGPAIAVDPRENNAFRFVGRALAAGGSVRVSGLGGGALRYVVTNPGRDAERWAAELALTADRTAATGEPVGTRIALYKPWRASMDEGWTEWLLDQHGIRFTTVSNADLRAGRLTDRFDVIIIASDSPRGLLDGYAKGSVPPRYEGGIGNEGVRELDGFVRGGGTLVCFNSSSDFAIQQLHLPVRNVVAGVDRKEFFASGSILRVATDTTHPVMAGMPPEAMIFFDDSPVFTTTEGFAGSALARYETEGNPLASGYLLGEARMAGHAAALDVRHGRGHVVLLGFRPQWRGQTWGTFRVALNAALFGGRAAAQAKGAADFWSPPKPAETAPAPTRPGRGG
ncbi:MAG: M14 family zinc carboxypeptidase [Gemmatimonadales bacterium]